MKVTVGPDATSLPPAFWLVMLSLCCGCCDKACLMCSGLSSPSEAGAPFLNAAGYVYTGITPARPASASAAARSRAHTFAHGAREPEQGPSPEANPDPGLQRSASAAGGAPPHWATPLGSEGGFPLGLVPDGGSGASGSLLSSAEGFPRSFQLVRSGSTDSLASQVRAQRPPPPTAVRCS